MFRLITSFRPEGDQPNAIQKIVENIQKGHHEQVHLGVIGTGKTFTMTNIIQQSQEPTKTNWTPWLIGGGIILVLVIVLIAYSWSRKKKSIK